MIESRYPEYSKPFSEMAWKGFDFDAVMEVLLDGEASFPHHKTILFRALGGWVIAPHQKNERLDAVRLGIRLAIKSHEKKIINLDPDAQYEADIALRRDELGKEFLTQIYYPSGGIAALHSATHTVERKSRISKEYRSAVRSLNKLLQIIHFVATREWDQGKFHKISLERCYLALEEITRAAASAEEHLGENSLEPYLKKKALQSALANYRACAVLCYAARETEVAEGGTLLSRFAGVHNSIRNRHIVIREWLGAASYLAKIIEEHIDSAHLSKVSELMALKDYYRELPQPILPDYQIECIHNVMKKSYRPRTS